MSCAWSLTRLGNLEQAYPMCGVPHGLFLDSANVFLTASAVGIELPILSMGSVSANHFTPGSIPRGSGLFQVQFKVYLNLNFIEPVLN